MTKRFLPALMAFSALSMAGLGGCHGSRTQTASTTVSQASASAPEQTAPTKTSTAASGPLACADEIGPAAAQRLVKMCLNMSGATHPPCNVQNTCAMMQDEIARNCAMSDDGGHPAPECTPAPKSSEAAAAVVQLYYSALNARDYDTAWRQWGDNGPPNQTLAKFASSFAHTRSTHVTVGRLDPAEGAAGSIYQSVPVTVAATLDDGRRQRFTGNYVVRRVNGVDGATPDQLRWHIGSASLKPAP